MRQNVFCLLHLSAASVTVFLLMLLGRSMVCSSRVAGGRSLCATTSWTSDLLVAAEEVSIGAGLLFDELLKLSLVGFDKLLGQRAIDEKVLHVPFGELNFVLFTVLDADFFAYHRKDLDRAVVIKHMSGLEAVMLDS